MSSGNDVQVTAAATSKHPHTIKLLLAGRSASPASLTSVILLVFDSTESVQWFQQKVYNGFNKKFKNDFSARLDQHDMALE